MSSDIREEMGRKKRVSTDTKGTIIIKRDGTIYKQQFKKLSSGETKLLGLILKYMSTDTNHIILGGDTIKIIEKESAYNEKYILELASKLKRKHFLNYCKRFPREYIVNPTFATKGNEESIWQFIQTVEYQCREE